NEVARDAERDLRRLIVHRLEREREERRHRRRLPNVHVRVVVHVAVTHFREDVHACLALRNGEVGPVQRLVPRRQRLQLPGVLQERRHLLLSLHRTEPAQYLLHRGRQCDWAAFTGRLLAHVEESNRDRMSGARLAAADGFACTGTRRSWSSDVCVLLPDQGAIKMPARSASATGKGVLKGGKGSFSGESGAIAGDYSSSSRFENSGGTNPA